MIPSITNAWWYISLAYAGAGLTLFVYVAWVAWTRRRLRQLIEVMKDGDNYG